MPMEARVPADKVKSASDALTKLAKKPPATLSLRAAIEKLAPSIKAAVATGHSWDDVARALSESGISIKGGTVAAYVRDMEKSQADDSLPA